MPPSIVSHDRGRYRLIVVRVRGPMRRGDAPGQAALGDQVEGVVADDHHPRGSATGHPTWPARVGRLRRAGPPVSPRRPPLRACRSASATPAYLAVSAMEPCPVPSELRGGDGAERVGGAGCAAATRGGDRPRPPDERSDHHQRTQCTVSAALPVPPPGPGTRSSAGHVPFFFFFFFTARIPGGNATPLSVSGAHRSALTYRAGSTPQARTSHRASVAGRLQPTQLYVGRSRRRRP